MSCWSWLRCKPSDNQDPWASSPWSTPQWTQQEIPTWTYNRFRGFDDDDNTPLPSPRTPKHRILRSPAGILKERRDWRPEASPIRNPGISVRPENIPRLFPQTPGNGRPRSFVDPNPVVGETLANSIPTPRWQPINPWVGNSFVATPQNGSGQSLLCTPLATPGSLPQSVMPLPGATPVTMVPTPLPNATPLPCTPADTSSTWVHLRNFPAWTNTPVPGTPFTPSRCPQEMQNSDCFDDAPVIPQFDPHRPSLLRTPGSVRSHVSLTPGSTVAKIPSQTGVWMPMDQVGWEPHPCPDPMQHADAFWTPHPFSVPRQYWTPRDHASMMRLTGGVPAPGTAPGWVSPAWPMQAASPAQASVSLHLNPTLTPNPNNAWLPHLVWDVSEHPSYARRLTGRELTVPIVDRLEQSAVWPNSTVLHIYVDHHLATTAFWGPIIVKNKKAITIYDVLMAIFEYFQTQLRQEEYDYLVGLDPDNIAKMCDSFQQRCIISRNQLPLYERAQGLRRIDTFGDKRRWWGLWVTHKPGGAHYLNLGLVDTRRVSRLF